MKPTTDNSSDLALQAAAPVTAVRRSRRPGPGTLATEFDPRLNGLNLVRLLLAIGVLLRHSFTMLGAPIGWEPVLNVLRSSFVDGFFGISGYLIVSSWVNKPDWRRYLRARCVRILPGFWICLLVTAFIAAPVQAWLTGVRVNGAFLLDGARYVGSNSALWIFQDGIAGGPLGAARNESGVWNGSLWTLSWEFICYLGVLALGVAGLIRLRSVILGLFVASVAVLALTETSWLDISLVHHGARFATMFMAGALLYTWRAKVPVRAWLLPVAALIVLFAGYLPEYRIIAALPLAYLCIATGALIKVPALRLPNDLSYGTYIYGFPIQQLLVACGAATLGVPMFFVITVACVLPVAAMSWFLVERPAQRWNRRSSSGSTAPSTSVRGSDQATSGR